MADMKRATRLSLTAHHGWLVPVEPDEVEDCDGCVVLLGPMVALPDEEAPLLLLALEHGLAPELPLLAVPLVVPLLGPIAVVQGEPQSGDSPVGCPRASPRKPTTVAIQC